MDDPDDTLRNLRYLLMEMRGEKPPSDEVSPTEGLRLIKIFMSLSERNRSRVIEFAETLRDQPT
jgi:hypothetical protein